MKIETENSINHLGPDWSIIRIFPRVWKIKYQGFEEKAFGLEKKSRKKVNTVIKFKMIERFIIFCKNGKLEKMLAVSEKIFYHGKRFQCIVNKKPECQT